MCRVLVIEDCSLDFEDIKRKLHDFDISWARSLREAAQQEKPDIILLDLYTPGHSGIESLAAAREKFPNAPIVIHSGSDSFSVAEEAIKRGAQDYVVKGASAQELRKTLKFSLERHTLQVKLEEARRNTISEIERKALFLSRMSHEIRTPLSTIIGYSEVASEDPSQVNQALASIKRNSQHLLGLINKILDISKIDAGKYEIQLEPVNISEIVNGTGEDFSLKARKNNNKIEVRVQRNIPDFVKTDEAAFKQILFNLIGNAVKFTRDGEITISLNHINNNIRLAVSDTGKGISPEAQKTLFEPFTQASKENQGTGLGLTITRGLVKELGGTLELTSTPGKGSTFKVNIPAVPVEGWKPGRKEQNDTQLVPALNGSILVVDDMEDNRNLFKYHLLKAGVSVRVAEDGIDALAKLANSKFDLVLLDLEMPRMNGFKTIEAIRQKEINIPVIAITATVSRDAKQQCISRGFSSFLEKPFKVGDLYKEISNFLGTTYSDDDSFEVPTQVVLRFLEGLPKRISELSAAYNAGNTEETRLVAHKLAGAGLFGFDELGKAARGVCKAIEDGEEELVAESMKQVDVLYHLALKEKDKLQLT